MKPSLYLLIPALFLVSCDQQEVDASRLVTRNDTAYEINSNTPFTGVSLTYHENGQVEERITFKAGKRDGLSELYQQNGELTVSKNFKEGKQLVEDPASSKQAEVLEIPSRYALEPPQTPLMGR